MGRGCGSPLRHPLGAVRIWKNRIQAGGAAPGYCLKRLPGPRVGEAGTPSLKGSLTRVHPLAGGGIVWFCRCCRMLSGRSPRGWGKLPAGPEVRRLERWIPSRVGGSSPPQRDSHAVNGRFPRGVGEALEPGYLSSFRRGQERWCPCLVGSSWLWTGMWETWRVDSLAREVVSGAGCCVASGFPRFWGDGRWSVSLPPPSWVGVGCLPQGCHVPGVMAGDGLDCLVHEVDVLGGEMVSPGWSGWHGGSSGVVNGCCQQRSFSYAGLGLGVSWPRSRLASR